MRISGAVRSAADSEYLHGGDSHRHAELPAAWRGVRDLFAAAYADDGGDSAGGGALGGTVPARFFLVGLLLRREHGGWRYRVFPGRVLSVAGVRHGDCQLHGGGSESGGRAAGAGSGREAQLGRQHRRGRRHRPRATPARSSVGHRALRADSIGRGGGVDTHSVPDSGPHRLHVFHNPGNVSAGDWRGQFGRFLVDAKPAKPAGVAWGLPVSAGANRRLGRVPDGRFFALLAGQPAFRQGAVAGLFG